MIRTRNDEATEVDDQVQDQAQAFVLEADFITVCNQVLYGVKDMH